VDAAATIAAADAADVTKLPMQLQTKRPIRYQRIGLFSSFFTYPYIP
jgi:hypothetical protein